MGELLDFVAVAHIVVGIIYTFFGLCMNYVMYRNYYQSSRDGKKFVSQLHIYSRRYPTISLFSVTEIVYATGLLMLIFYANQPFAWRFENGGFKPCCVGFGHFTWVTFLLLDGVLGIISKNVNVPWPKDIERLTFAIVYYCISFSFYDHTLHTHHPLIILVHFLVAFIHFAIASLLLLENCLPNSFLVTFMRHVFFILFGTWNFQLGWMFTTNPLDEHVITVAEKYNAEDDTNLSFSIISFTVHVFGIAFCMLITYLVHALRWSKQDGGRAGGGAAVIGKTHNNNICVEYEGQTKGLLAP